jgi:hypothetical protein
MTVPSGNFFFFTAVALVALAWSRLSIVCPQWFGEKGFTPVAGRSQSMQTGIEWGLGCCCWN